MERIIRELERLCLINGISGDEGSVREYILSRLDGKADTAVDSLGNIIAFVKGKKRSRNRFMISAHMDEVGMIVSYIEEDGAIRISPVGGIDPRVVFGRRVTVGKNRILGTVGGAAVHNLTSEERKAAVPFDKLTVDIGCDSREQVCQLVSLGDSVCFDSEFVKMGNGLVKCKAIDDRAGCAIMLAMIDDGMEYDAYFVFTVQEEIGLRGSKCAAYTVDPDIAMVLESTTAADIPSVSGADRVCSLGKGAVVSYMDKSTVYDRELYDLAFSLADKNGIPCQTKTKIAGGNDSGAIHLSKGGVRTCAVSLPCRYLHSPSCVIDRRDLESCYRLAGLIAASVCGL